MEKYPLIEIARKSVPLHWLGNVWICGVLYLLLLAVDAYYLWVKYTKNELWVIDIVLLFLYLATFFAFLVMIRKKDEIAIFCATHDTQTCLPLRLFFRRKAQEIIDNAKEGEQYAFVIIRLDQYHLINFIMGFPISDEIIRNLYLKIKTQAKPDDIIAQITNRMIGVMYKYKSISEVNRFILSIKESCKEGLKVGDLKVDTSVHVGISLYPKDGQIVPDLVKRAIYAGHLAEKNFQFHTFYDQDKDYYNRFHLSMLSEMKQGMKDGSMELYYQPKLNTKKNMIDEVEALVRWNHPEKGSISPDEFIKIAEQTDFIDELSSWILESAIKQCKKWEENNIYMKVAVNVSIKNIINSDIIDLIPNLLEAYDLHPSKLLIEVTETGIMKNPKLVIDNLRILRKHGIGIAIDDFGTGMSSLEYIKILPVQELKLDRCFIQSIDKEPRDAALVQSVHDFGTKLGFSTVAEGCETEQVFNVLVEIGITRIQGYYISPALSVDNFLPWLQGSQWKLPQNGMDKHK